MKKIGVNMGKIGLNVMGSGIEYTWDKTVKDPNTDKKIILNILKSFKIGIDCEEDIDPNEIDQLLKTIKGNGHLGKFSDEELEDYIKLVKYTKKIKKKKKKENIKILNDLIEEVNNTKYDDRILIIDKSKRIVSGLFGEESQRYNEFLGTDFQSEKKGYNRDVGWPMIWNTQIKKNIYAKLRAYIAEIDII